MPVSKHDAGYRLGVYSLDCLDQSNRGEAVEWGFLEVRYYCRHYGFQ